MAQADGAQTPPYVASTQRQTHFYMLGPSSMGIVFRLQPPPLRTTLQRYKNYLINAQSHRQRNTKWRLRPGDYKILSRTCETLKAR
jgi:hypothetical protein